VTAILFVAPIPFFGFAELQRVFAEARLQELFFRSRRLEQAASGEAAKET